MKTSIDCIPCFYKQAITAAKFANCDELTHRRIIDELSKIVACLDMNNPPPVIGRSIYRLVEKISNCPDPFNSVKEKANILAKRVYPKLLYWLNHSEDRLLTAIDIAALGNMIDYGAQYSFDYNTEIEKLIKGEFINLNKPIFEYEAFKTVLNKAEIILYILDNAGEVLFDRVLMEVLKKLGKQIIISYRHGPIINDATITDVKFCNLDELGELISSGCDAPGVLLNTCSEEFLKYYNTVDLIISKGQGNFEALEGSAQRTISFLFKIKCLIVAQYLGCQVGDVILKVITHNFGKF